MTSLVIGLTGGIASGKSSVARLFGELGAEVISADQLARQVVEPGSAALAAILDHFGPDMLLPSGELDRQALRQAIFRNDHDRLWLEALLHPRIEALRQQRVELSTAPYVVAEIPLLVEKRMQGSVDRVLVVDLPEELQIERAMARDGADRAGIEAIMATQAPRSERLMVANDVIENTGNENNLRQQVTTLHRRYLELTQRS